MICPAWKLPIEMVSLLQQQHFPSLFSLKWFIHKQFLTVFGIVSFLYGVDSGSEPLSYLVALLLHS
jgi:hypothetical protein